MKNNLVITALTGLICVGALACAIFTFRLITGTKTLNQAQLRLFQANNDRAVAQSLLAEVAEYSKTHAAIEPILAQFLGRPAAQPTGTTNRPPSR